MGIKISKKDIIWGYASQIFQFGTGIIILPMILRKLSTEELGIWYIFLTITAFVNLLDFGFQQTITRNVSYVFSGAKTLLKVGIEEYNTTKEIDYRLLKSLIITVKMIYRIIAIIGFIILITIGSFYLNSLIEGLDKKIIFLAWGIYSLSATFNLYFYYYTPLLLGRGLINESHKTIVLSKLFYILFSIIALQLGFGLVGIAIGNLLSSFINRASSYYFFYDKELKNKLKKAYDKEKINLLPILWENSYKMGLVIIGSFLILRMNTLLVGKYLNLEIVASYGLTLQIVSFLMQTSVILFNTYLPLFNSLRLKNKIEEMKEKFSAIFLIMLITYIIGSIVIIILGNKIVNILGSSTKLMQTKYLIFLLFIYLLELNHSIAASMITTKNEIPFVKSSLFSGIGIVILSLILLNYSNLGILSVLLSQFFVQISYNNWKWPRVILKDLNTNYLEMFKISIKIIFFKEKNNLKK